jgi:hypothetical protein
MFCVPAYRDALSPSPPSLATPFPAGRKSTAGIVNLFLPAGNFARILLTTYLAYVLALKGAGKPPRGRRRAGKDHPACHDVHENIRTSEKFEGIP